MCVGGFAFDNLSLTDTHICISSDVSSHAVCINAVSSHQSMNRNLIANTMVEIPFKKRRFWYNSVAPSGQTSLQSPKEHNSSEHLGEPEQILRSTSRKSLSEFGVIHGSVAAMSAAGTSEVKNARNVEIPVAIVPMDETVASLEPDCLVKAESVNRPGLLVQVDSLTQSTNIHSDKNDGALGKSIPQKTDRLHWDLNIMMDEWEKPYAEIVDQQISNSEYVTNGGIQNGKVASDPDSKPNIEDPQSMLLETKGPDSERNMLQVSSGLINTEKTCAVFETQDLTMVINMNDLNNNLRLDRNECEFIEEKNNTANIPLQYDKDMTRTPAAVLCKLSSQSDTTEKSGSVSFGKPSIGEPACYVDSMKDEGSEDLKINSEKVPKLTSEDLSSGCRNSNFSGNNMDHVISVECMSNLQSGYDSPIEDGELREPDAYFWKNNEVNSSETGQLDNELVGTDYIDAFENNYKNENQLWDHPDDANTEGQDGELNDNGSQTREFGAGKYRKKLPSYYGPIQRNNFPFMQRQRKNENNGCEVGFPVTYQESRSYNPHSYRYSKDQDHSRLRRVNSGPAARGTDMSSYDNRQFSDNFSNDIYRPSTRKRLPADRDDSNDSYTRAPPLRSKKKRNKKKKYGFYQQRGMKAPKENYNERLPDKYSSRMDHKSFTNFNQAAHITRPYRKSQSESSLCSPTYALNEQGQGSSGSVSRHSQRQGNHVDPRRLKSDGNSRFLARYERNSQVVTTGRECSFQNSDLDRNIHHAKFKKYQA
ncbi:hypothetical protein POM88_009370 [Heracleum sosnowskyi]|uniref:Uncharacterized protein n=1 Tax=Heracleum sosnowskyi TaxID=360622 RepID=A0AAD8JBT6_9APIA|nr:hypothetical protein POM88_009370 [Heracleum sosnowskyi]